MNGPDLARFDHKKRICLEIDLDDWRTFEDMARIARREPRPHLQVLLEQLAAKHRATTRPAATVA
jgi:hypothetical protein